MVLSDGVLPSGTNNLVLHNNRIDLIDNTGTGTTTTLTTQNLSQTTAGPTTIQATVVDIINAANAGTPNLQAVLTSGNSADNSISLTDGTQTNQLQKTSIAITNPISNGVSSISANGLQFTTDDPTLSSGGISITTTSSSAQLAGGVAGLPSFPYPAPDANFNLYTDTSTFNPTLYLSKNAPFTNFTSMTLDLNNLIHNQSTGSPSPDNPFTISTNKDLVLSSGNSNNKQIYLKPDATSGPGTVAIQLSTNTVDRMIIEKSANMTTLYQTGGSNGTFAMRMAANGTNANELRLVTTSGAPLFRLDNGAFQSSQLQYLGTDFQFTTPQSGTYTFKSGGTNNGVVINNGGVGYTTQPQFTLNNTNTTAGNTTGVPSVHYYKQGRNSVAGDVIGSDHYYANNQSSTKTEYARLEASVRGTGVGNDDGCMGFYFMTNGVLNEVFRMNGADNENNTFRPIDMNGQDLKTSSGNMGISASSSSGTGTITITPKSGGGLILQNLPTSSFGLPAGSVWNNGGVLHIV
jgi:hypothetical protein